MVWSYVDSPLLLASSYSFVVLISSDLIYLFFLDGMARQVDLLWRDVFIKKSEVNEVKSMNSSMIKFQVPGYGE